MVWNQVRTNVLLVLMWVQTVCKSYQQMKKVAAIKEEVKVKVMDLIIGSAVAQW